MPPNWDCTIVQHLYVFLIAVTQGRSHPPGMPSRDSNQGPIMCQAGALTT